MTVKERVVSDAAAMPPPDFEYKMTLANRTPEEIAETRRRIYAMSPEPRELPPGKTLEDVIVGQWPGDETDEEISEALRDLS